MRQFLFFFLLLSINLPLSSQELEERGLRLEDYDYPAPAGFFELEVQQQKLEMAYLDVKPPNFNGKTIVLLHGKNFNAAYWETTIDTLTSQGYRVLAPDQIGFGKSSKPEYFQYSFQQLAQNTKKLLEHLHIEKASILGHSMGGMLATRFALMYPNLTEKLILVNPIGLEDWKLKIPYQSVDDWYQRELNSSYESIRKYQRENYYDGEWNEHYARWARLLAGWTLNDNYPLIAWNSALTYDMILTQPVLYEFPELEMPVLLIIGTRDRTALGKNLVSKEVRETMGRYDGLGKETRDRIPDASLEELDGIGHLPHIEAFDRFITPLLQFLP